MADRIKGITVVIGGDTTGLDKALKDVNKEISDTQRQLKDVERLLKLDPTNTELLAQKQRLLGDAVQETKTKLTALKEAEKQVQEQFRRGEVSQKQYDGFQREIVETENKLKDLEDAARNSNVQLSKISTTASKISTGAGKISSAMKPVTTAIAGLGAAAVATVPGTEELRSDLSKLDNAAEDNGVAVDAARQAWEDFVVATDEVDSSVEATANLLQAGFDETNLERAMEGITGAYLRFPDTLKIESLADSLQETLATGEATGQFAELLDRLGIGAENFDAQLAKATTDAEKQNLVLQTLADAGLNDTYEAWKKNNEELTANKEANLEFQQALAELAEKIQPILTKVVTAVTDLLNSFLDLPGPVQGAIVTLLGIVAAIGPVAGAISNIANAVPAITKAVPAIGGAFTKVAGVVGGAVGKIGSVLLGPVGVIAALVAGVAVFGDQIQEKLGEVDSYLEGVFAKDWTEVFGPTLGGALNGFLDTVEGIWGSLKSVLDGIIDLIRGVFTLDFERAWEGVKEIASGVATGIFNIFKAPFELLRTLVSTLWGGAVSGALSDGWTAVTEFFTTKIPEFIDGVKEWFADLPHALGEMVGQLLGHLYNFGTGLVKFATEDIPNFVNGVVEWFSQLPGRVAEWLTNTLTAVGLWGVQMLQQAIATAQNFINNIVTFIQQLPGKIYIWLQNALQKVQEWAANLINTARTEIPKFVDMVVGFFMELPGKIFDIGKNIVQGLWDGIQSMAGWIGDKVSGFIDGILDGFRDTTESHSPSRLFAREVGEPIGEGVEVGILDKLAGMTGAIDRMLTGQVASLSGILSVPAAAGASPVTNNSDYSRTFGGITVNVYGAAGTQAEAADYGKLIGQQAWRAMRARGVT